MPNPVELKGIISPLITPFLADAKTVNVESVVALVEHQVQLGVHALFVAGTTGESMSLDDEQWRRLLQAVTATVAGRIPVIVGVSMPSTAGAVRRAGWAAELGANYVTATIPYYFLPSQQDIVRHYRSIEDATPLPLVVYNIPHLTKVSIALATYLELARSPRMVALKDSSGDITALRRLKWALAERGREDIRLFMGTDLMIDAIVVMGAHGVVPSLANLAPHVLVGAWDAAVAGDWPTCWRLLERAALLTRIYQVHPSGAEAGTVAGLKAALAQIGIDCGPPALPTMPLDEAGQNVVKTILHDGGLAV